MASIPSTQLPPEYLEEYTGNRVLAATTIILVLSTVLLGLRLYARSLTRAALGSDDFILLPAWILLLGLIICLYSKLLQYPFCIKEIYKPNELFALTLFTSPGSPCQPGPPRASRGG